MYITLLTKWSSNSVSHEPPYLNSDYFLDSWSSAIDYYSNVYDKDIVIDKLNIKPSPKSVEIFAKAHNHFNLTSFVSSINLILIIGNITFKALSKYK